MISFLLTFLLVSGHYFFERWYILLEFKIKNIVVFLEQKYEETLALSLFPSSLPAI